MAALKLLLTAAILLVLPACRNPAGLTHRPFYVLRSDLVREHYRIEGKRLQDYYESLFAALKAHAPDLLLMLEPPKPLRHGYQVLPQIIPDALSSKSPRARSAWYSWPWTDQLIDEESREVGRAAGELRRATALNPTASRSVYEKLARGYRQIREQRQIIDAHIQYNRLWQAAIAAQRARYDRETALHDEVLERQKILDALKTVDDAAFRFERISGWQAMRRLKIGLRQREQRLARDIGGVTADLDTPAFLRVEHRGSHSTILRVPLYTDIDDHDFVESVKGAIENIWRLRDGEDEFSIELVISYLPATRLLTKHQGNVIDGYQRLSLFPSDGAVLTTGALTTHVYGRAILLGPHDIGPRVLAHEFGHILGFRDAYFRGYKDLGKDGFRVMEVVADPNDIMGAPDTGTVLRRHFERILAAVGKANSPQPRGAL